MLKTSHINAINIDTASMCRQIMSMLVLTISLLVFTSAVVQAKVNHKYAAFVMDADTGLILHQENANKRLHPASLTKMMTLLMVFDALDHGAINLNTKIKISKHAASMIPSKLGLEPGETIKIKDAIYAITTKSANDIAVALAEKLGKTERNFAKMMTKKARSLGMKKTYFMNASGLHNPKQVSSARDMARLGRILVTKYKHHYHYFSKKSFTYKGKTYKSHNKLMSTYEGMDGLKTGYINKSGFNLVSSAIRNDRRLIGVVFGGKTGKSRNARMKVILDNAFDKIGTYRIASNNIPVPHKKPISPIYRTSLYKFPPPPTMLPKIRLAKSKNVITERWAMLNSANDKSMFNRMIGQGDYDINVRNRIETGLIAISAHMGEQIPDYVFAKPKYKHIKLLNTPKNMEVQHGNWSIQVGAFTSRERSNNAIALSKKRLPSYLRHEESTVAPIKGSKGWVFRSRLHGYTKERAKDACKILGDCVIIAPRT